MKLAPLAVVVVVGAGWLSHQALTDGTAAACEQPVTAETAVLFAAETTGGAIHSLTEGAPSSEVVAEQTLGTMDVLGTWGAGFTAALRGEERPESVARYEARAVSVHQASLAACTPCPAGAVATPAGAPAVDITRAAAQAAGFTGEDLDIAVAVAAAESGHRDVDNAGTNRNGTVDYGRWQINTVHADLLAAGDWRDPQQNARMAYAVWERAGRSWTPWVTYNNGAYREHLGTTAASSQPSTNLAAACAPGATVQPATTTAAPAGSATVDDLIAYGHELRNRGYRVTENAALGDPPSSGSHSPTGWHYKHDGSGAIDVNSRPGTTRAEQVELAPIAVEAQARGFGVQFMSRGHFGHLHIDAGDYRRVGDLSGLLTGGAV